MLHLTTSDVSVRFLLLDQLKYLIARGFEVHAASGTTTWTAEIESHGIRMHNVDMSRRVTPREDVRSFQQLRSIIRRLRPDIVHTHTPKASLLGQYAALSSGTRVRVHTIHGLYFPASARGSRLLPFLALEWTTMAPAHRVLSQSSEDVRTCLRYRLCSADRLRYLGNGIDVDRFRPPSAAEVVAARASLALRPSDRVVGIVGRLVREKGYLEFFAAAAILIRGHPDVRFLVIGPEEPDKTDAISNRDAARFGLGDRIQFLGMRTDVERLYWAMDILAFPSHREGFPRTPMEASACGCPVVAADVRGSREAVRPGFNGELVPVRDPTALARAIDGLLRDDARRTALGRSARNLALAEFDQRLVFERVATAYSELRPL